MTDGRLHLSEGTEDNQRRTPWESVIFAWAGVVPIALGAIAFFLMRGEAAAVAARLTTIFAGAILCFLAGVRRGLGFRQPGGPLATQLATMLGLFALGLAGLASPWPSVSLGLEIAGFATMAVYDPYAARQGETPRYFARLRPVQMAVPVVALAALLISGLAR